MNPSPLRIALLGAWHVHAAEYADHVNRHPGAAIAAVWDDDVARGTAAAARLGVPFIADQARLLADPAIAGVVVCAATTQHAALITAAAHAGKHVCTEKVLAATDAEAEGIAAAVRAAGIHFAIVLPHRAQPGNRYAKEVLDRGLLGEIAGLHFRNAHNGIAGGWLPAAFLDPAACGGGAMLDLGSHGMYLAAWLLGLPTHVHATFSSRSEAARGLDDHSVAVLRYADGRLAMNETGFLSFASPCSLELSGSAGCLLVGGHDQTVRLRSKLLPDDGKNWHVITDLPPAGAHSIDQWLDAIADRRTIEDDLDAALTLTALMDAAYRSWRSGSAEAVRAPQQFTT